MMQIRQSYFAEKCCELVPTISSQDYSKLADGIEVALDEADLCALDNDTMYTHEEVFSNLWRRLDSWPFAAHDFVE